MTQSKKRRKKSLVGWTYKGFKLHWNDTIFGCSAIHSEVLKDRSQLRLIDKPTKVRITIEEIKDEH